jgi:hypothetical protein
VERSSAVRGRLNHSLRSFVCLHGSLNSSGSSPISNDPPPGHSALDPRQETRPISVTEIAALNYKCPKSSLLVVYLTTLFRLHTSDKRCQDGFRYRVLKDVEEMTVTRF